MNTRAHTELAGVLAVRCAAKLESVNWGRGAIVLSRRSPASSTSTWGMVHYSQCGLHWVRGA